jgi:hypothetical protein
VRYGSWPWTTYFSNWANRGLASGLMLLLMMGSFMAQWRSSSRMVLCFASKPCVPSLRTSLDHYGKEIDSRSYTKSPAVIGPNVDLINVLVKL